MEVKARAIYCPHCAPRHKIGEIDGGNCVVIRHRGREIRVGFPVMIRCEKCGCIVHIKELNGDGTD